MFVFAFGSLLLTGCNETGVNEIKPDTNPPGPNIVVTPVALEFGQLMSNEEELQTFLVRNVGEGALTVDDITVELSDAFTIASPTGFVLEAEAEVAIDVVFSPLGVDNIGQAVVFSNDPDEPETLVQLSGFGSVPELEISPDPYDFGTRFIPCGDFTTLTLTNVGGDELLIDSIDHISDGDFFLDDPNVFPVALAPGEFTSVNVTYTPSIVGEQIGELQVLSNDPRGLVTALQTGTGQYGATTADTFDVPLDPPVDILFAVDQSCSMDDDSTLLGNNFGTFINTINVATEGWQIGVANVSDGCFNNGILSATTVGYQAAFQSAVVEGYDDTGDATLSERLFTLISMSLGKTSPGNCNAGFLRPGALLHVILVSDEPERSNNPNPGDAATFAGVWESYVADPTKLKVSTIIDQSGCGQGSAGYPAISNLTGGVILDLCGDWASQIGQLGSASLQGIERFALGQTADPDSLEVFVNGLPVTNWTFDVNANEVVFDTALTEGDIVDVNYGVLVACN